MREGFQKQKQRADEHPAYKKKFTFCRMTVLSIMFRFSCFLWFVAVLTSCLPEPLEVKNIPSVNPEIVVSTQIIPDSSLVVILTKSFSALDANTNTNPEELLNMISINDALVTITGEGRTDTLELIENGFYGGIRIPFKNNGIYELKVKSETMGEVKAVTEVKPKINFNKVEAGLFVDNFNDTLAQITYSFFDPEEVNWYMVNVQEAEQEDIIRNSINPGAYTILFGDADFKDNLREEQFRVTSRDYSPGDTIVVSLSNISREYYSFMKLRLDNRLNFIEFLSEPINYPSNIEGGKGFFNLYVPHIRTFVLENDL